MNKFSLLILLLVSSAHSYAQQRLSGYVEDKQSGEKLFGASILIKGTNVGATTNFYGFFSLPVHQSNATIVVSYVGYEQLEMELELQQGASVNIKLEPMGDLDEVVVQASRDLPFERQMQVSSIHIPIKQIQQLPAVGGEIDIMRGLQLLPGVQSGKEGLTGLYVRGGGPDQNLILLDGVPLYNVSHLGGIFSVFNSDIIADVNLIKGGFPARYGGRLSSVLNIKVREGNRNHRQTQGAIGLASARLSHEGPIKGGKGSYLFSLRRSYIDVFTRPISRIVTNGRSGFGYTFYDLNGKMNYDVSNKDKVYASVYTGHDRGVVSSRDTANNSNNQFQWGNVLATTRWNRVISDRLFSNLTLGYTNYKFSTGFNHQELGSDREVSYSYLSGIRDWHMKYDLEYFLSQQHTFRTGIQFIEHQFTPGVNVFSSSVEQVKTDTTFGSLNVNAREISLYAEDDWEINERLSMNLGIHLNTYLVNNETYFSPQPRTTLRWMTGPKSSVKFSYATMQQNVHLLSSTGVGLPTDLWVPATDRTRPQQSSQVTASFSKNIKGGYEFSIEAFYKRMSNLIDYSDGVNWLEGTSDWQEKIEREGEGRGKGLELFLHKKEGRITGWVGYTLSRAERRFSNINEGQYFPDRFDRRHDIGIMVTYNIKKNVDFSVTWVYGTGNAITLGEGHYLAMIDPSQGFFPGQNRIEHFEGRNNFRMRAFHRADVGLRFTKDKKWGERTWNLGFYNAYSRANPFYYYWGTQQSFFGGGGSLDGPRSLRQISLLPIIPAFSYEFKFY
jgi:outer membrane cobalamin receptor